MPKELLHFHVSHFGPTDPWPNGGWSLYRITGDEIAQRIGFDKRGLVNRRDSWPGYIGVWATIEEVAKAIAEIEKSEKVEGFTPGDLVQVRDKRDGQLAIERATFCAPRG